MVNATKLDFGSLIDGTFCIHTHLGFQGAHTTCKEENNVWHSGRIELIQENQYARELPRYL
jgi:hypothetical protein